MDITTDYSKYKTFWPRFWAGWIDAVVFLPLLWLDPMILLGYIPNLLTAILYLLWNISFYAYTVLMHGKFGQTLGKMACKVKVIDKSEDRPITYKQAIMRDSVIIVMGLISLIFYELPKIMQGLDPHRSNTMDSNMSTLVMFLYISMFWCWGLAELITMLTNKKRRAVHDLIAGSVVIKHSKQR